MPVSWSALSCRCDAAGECSDSERSDKDELKIRAEGSMKLVLHQSKGYPKGCRRVAPTLGRFGAGD